MYFHSVEAGKRTKYCPGRTAGALAVCWDGVQAFGASQLVLVEGEFMFEAII